MNIIAQFIWTISDALGVVGLVIVFSLLGAIWIWQKMDQRAERIREEQRRQMAKAAQSKQPIS